MSAETIKDKKQGLSGLGIFVGSFPHKLDPKKRLTIPSVWRTMVGDTESLFVAPDVVGRDCLLLFPADVMQQKIQALAEVSVTDADALDLLSEFSVNTDMLQWDVQGRIRIKDDMLERFKLKGEVLFAGAGRWFELWNPAAYAAYRASESKPSLQDAYKFVGI